MRKFRHRFFRHRLAVGSLILLLLLVVLSLSASLFETYLQVSATKTDLFARYQPADQSYLLGTDEAGRDVFTRLLYGGRISLLVGGLSAVFAAIIGTFIGLMAGVIGGRLDDLLMRFTDTVIALPLLPVLIILAALDLTKLGFSPEMAGSEGAALGRLIFIIALAGWTVTARLVRGVCLSVKRLDFVRAAKAMGAGQGRIMLVHILPNILSPIVIAASLSVGNIILLEAVLSFLGLGIPPSLPSWGNMLTNAQDLIFTAPLLAIWPGVMIFVTVIAFNFLGDGLRDALDPRFIEKR